MSLLSPDYMSIKERKDQHNDENDEMDKQFVCHAHNDEMDQQFDCHAHSVENDEMDQQFVCHAHNDEMDQQFDCHEHNVENDEMDQQFDCNAEIVNPSEYSQELVNDNSNNTPVLINRREMMCIAFYAFVGNFFLIAFILCINLSRTLGCRHGWKYDNKNCYNFNVGTDLSWSGCKSECASLGASMLCIPDSTTNDWIANQISRRGYLYSWIGFSDLPIDDGKFEWVSGCSSWYTYSTSYYDYDYFYIRYDGDWFLSHGYGSSSITCSCKYHISLDSKCFILLAVSVIILILSLIHYYKNKNRVLPSNNDDIIDISSSDQAYTDVPPTNPYPPSDDDDDGDDNGVNISSTTEELQGVLATNNDYYNDALPIDHEVDFIQITVQA